VQHSGIHGKAETVPVGRWLHVPVLKLDFLEFI
jgi:hypothetical protein